MRREELMKEARDCRGTAEAFAVRPELPFLLKLADAFEEIATEKQRENLRL